MKLNLDAKDLTELGVVAFAKISRILEFGPVKGYCH